MLGANGLFSLVAIFMLLGVLVTSSRAETVYDQDERRYQAEYEKQDQLRRTFNTKIEELASALQHIKGEWSNKQSADYSEMDDAVSRLKTIQSQGEVLKTEIRAQKNYPAGVAQIFRVDVTLEEANRISSGFEDILRNRRQNDSSGNYTISHEERDSKKSEVLGDCEGGRTFIATRWNGDSGWVVTAKISVIDSKLSMDAAIRKACRGF